MQSSINPTDFFSISPVRSGMVLNHIKAWFNLNMVSAFNNHIWNIPLQFWPKDRLVEMDDLTFKSEISVGADGNGNSLTYSLTHATADFTKLGEQGVDKDILINDISKVLMADAHIENGSIVGVFANISKNTVTVKIPLVKPFLKRLV